MKRPFWIALLAAVAFIVIMLARLPAAWVIPSGRPEGSCASIDGSLWSGTCAGLTVGKNAVGDVTWELQPLRLLLGRLAARVSLTHGAASATGDVEMTFGQRVTARNVVADLPLDPKLIPGLSRTLHGRARAELALLSIQRGIITDLKGRIEAHDLEDRSGAITPLGSYVVIFPGGGGEPVGKVHDLDGPIAFEGTLRLTRQPGYVLEGLIATRRDAPRELVNNIQWLGSPDASGRRQFGIEGTF